MRAIEIYGAMIGPKCAAIGFLTTMSTRLDPDIRGFIKKSGDADFTEYDDTKNIGRYVRFRHSAWEFDFLNLEPGTTYEAYINIETNIESEVSNHVTFTTTNEVSSFDCDFGYANYSSSGPVEAAPSEEQREVGDEAKERILSTIDSIGFVYNTQHTDVYLIPDASSMAGADGLTDGSIIYIQIRKLSRICDVFVHEMRHRLFFTGARMSGYGYASDIAYDDGYNMENFYKTFSFFDMNNNKSEIYYYYRENSCEEDSHLYDFFLLKALRNKHVEIVYFNQ